GGDNGLPQRAGERTAGRGRQHRTHHLRLITRALRPRVLQRWRASRTQSFLPLKSTFVPLLLLQLVPASCLHQGAGSWPGVVGLSMQRGSRATAAALSLYSALAQPTSAKASRDRNRKRRMG